VVILSVYFSDGKQ